MLEPCSETEPNDFGIIIIFLDYGEPKIDKNGSEGRSIRDSYPGRGANFRSIDALTVTIVSMGIGSLLLLATGVLVEETPRIDLAGWLIIIWLAVVNTTFAFTLWNHTLRMVSGCVICRSGLRMLKRH